VNIEAIEVLERFPRIGDHLSMIRSHHSTLAREVNEVLK